MKTLKSIIKEIIKKSNSFTGDLSTKEFIVFDDKINKRLLKYSLIVKREEKRIKKLKSFKIGEIKTVKPIYNNPYKGSITIGKKDFLRLIELSLLILKEDYMNYKDDNGNEIKAIDHYKNKILDKNCDCYIYGEHLGIRYSNEESDYTSIYSYDMPFKDIYENII